VPVSDIDGARAALRSGRPEELIGLHECSWLDVKSGIYLLDKPGGAEELAKDVAAFANAKNGGLLLVGYATRKEQDGEIVESVRPVPRDRVDLDRHRKLIRDRIIPTPRDVLIDWIDCGEGKGILVIDVPVQPSARLPHVVAGPSKSAESSQISVAIPIREGDATAWLSQSESQRLLSAGWTATGGPSDEFLGGLIEQAVTAAHRQVPPPPGQVTGIGEGEPGWRGLFQQAYNDLMNRMPRIWIGEPASTVYWDGPGVVQQFEAAHLLFGWVLCALPHRRPVAVAGEVWRAMHEVGAGALGGDALTAVGYPVPDQQATRVVDAEGTSVEMTGGEWGNGRLVRRAGTAGWSWEPDVRYDMRMTRGSGYWAPTPTGPQLRMRAVVTLPWASPTEPAITPERRRAVEQRLPLSDLTTLITSLSKHRGANLPTLEWSRGPNRNALDALSYSTAVTTADGRIALSAEVMVALPGGADTTFTGCAELRIHDLDAWVEAGSGTPARLDPRLSPGEAVEFFVVAWQTAAEVLPRAVTTDTDGVLWTSPPAVDLRLIAEGRFDNVPQPQPVLDDYIDLDPLGQSDRGQLREMTVCVTAPPVLDRAVRESYTREALAYMAQQFGFLDATAGGL
jgi:hypothetical protein